MNMTLSPFRIEEFPWNTPEEDGKERSFSRQDFESIFFVHEIRDDDRSLTHVERTEQQQTKSKLQQILSNWDTSLSATERVVDTIQDRLSDYAVVRSTVRDENDRVKILDSLPESSDLKEVGSLLSRTLYTAELIEGLPETLTTDSLLNLSPDILLPFLNEQSDIFILFPSYSEAQSDIAKPRRPIWQRVRDQLKGRKQEIASQIISNIRNTRDLLQENTKQILLALGVSVNRLDTEGWELPPKTNIERVFALAEQIGRIQKVLSPYLSTEDLKLVKSIQDRLDAKKKRLENQRTAEVDTIRKKLAQTYQHSLQELSTLLKNGPEQLTKENVELLQTIISSMREKLIQPYPSTVYTDQDTNPQIRDQSYWLDQLNELSKLANGKSAHQLQIGNPDSIRSHISQEYKRRKSEDESQARLWLKEALRLLQEYTRRQAELFLEAYDELWDMLKRAGSRPIRMETKDISEVFDRSKVSFSYYALDAVKHFESIIETHNYVCQYLERTEQTRFGPIRRQRSSSEFFQALTGLDPVGTVHIVTTAPITSIRFICENDIDYFRLQGVTNIEDISEAQQQESGVSFNYDRTFNFPDIDKPVRLPVTAVRGEHSSRTERISIVTHEDSHRNIILDRLQGTRLGESSVPPIIDLTFPDSKNHREQSQKTINAWRNELRQNTRYGLQHARDEIQAYVSEGASVDTIRSHLADSELYNYISPDRWTKRWKQWFHDHSEDETLSFADIEADIAIAREAYLNKIDQMLQAVKLLSGHMNQAQRDPKKLAVFLRFFPAEDWIHLYRTIRKRN